MAGRPLNREEATAVCGKMTSNLRGGHSVMWQRDQKLESRASYGKLNEVRYHGTKSRETFLESLEYDQKHEMEIWSYGIIESLKP